MFYLQGNFEDDETNSPFLHIIIMIVQSNHTFEMCLNQIVENGKCKINFCNINNNAVCQRLIWCLCPVVKGYRTNFCFCNYKRCRSNRFQENNYYFSYYLIIVLQTEDIGQHKRAIENTRFTDCKDNLEYDKSELSIFIIILACLIHSTKSILKKYLSTLTYRK